MKHVFRIKSSETALSRRTVLRGFGVGLSLPLLEAMTPSRACAAQGASPKRLIAIETNMGILPQFFFPKETGRGYEPSPYLGILNDYQSQMTVFSGVSHPEVDGGHKAEDCFLTAAPHPGRGGFRNTISVDQFAAVRIGHLTRFPSLALSVGTRKSLSYTSSGVQIPGETSPAKLFKRLFVQGSPEEVQAQINRLQQGRSILDSVVDRTRQLQTQVSPGDRQKLDQFYTGVRELEQRLQKSEQWELRPKTPVAEKPPRDNKDRSALIERTRAMYGLARLAIETDSTRLVTVFVHQNDVKPSIPGVDSGTHPLTHHGNQPEKLAQLRRIEEAQFQVLAELFQGLSATQETDGSLLDRTSVVYGTCMGNTNAHSNNNLPVLLAGGGFKHGQHLGFNPERNDPLPNLFVSVLQQLGVETDRFATSTGTMRGLEG